MQSHKKDFDSKYKQSLTGLFARNMSILVTVRVYYCANDDGYNGFQTIGKNVDEQGDGDVICKRSLKLVIIFDTNQTIQSQLSQFIKIVTNRVCQFYLD